MFGRKTPEAEPSVNSGWAIFDIQEVPSNGDRYSGDKSRILWGREGEVRVTYVDGIWEYEALAAALGQPL
jgi:hypothetical protein